MEKSHYSLSEKTTIILTELGSEHYKPHAEKIANLVDSFAFLNLKDLARALTIIAKGKK